MFCFKTLFLTFENQSVILTCATFLDSDPFTIVGGHVNDRTLYSEERSNRLRGFDHQIIYCLNFTFPRMNSFSVYTLPYFWLKKFLVTFSIGF